MTSPTTTQQKTSWDMQHSIRSMGFP